MISDPITFPSRSIRLPFACLWKIVCAIPVTANGYRIPVIIVSTKVIRIAGLSSFSIFISLSPYARCSFLGQVQEAEQPVYGPDAGERRDDPSQSIDEEV